MEGCVNNVYCDIDISNAGMIAAMVDFVSFAIFGRDPRNFNTSSYKQQVFCDYASPENAINIKVDSQMPNVKDE